MESNVVSYAPHITKQKNGVNRLYLNFAISLLPALFFGIVVFGFNAIFITVICLLSTMGYDVVYNLIKRKKFLIEDYSTLYLAILVAVCTPAGVPAWWPILGCIIGEFVIKRCCGGIGRNYVSQGAIANVITFVAFPLASTKYVTAFKHLKTSVTTIYAVNAGVAPADGFVKVLFGLVPGGIGETAILFLVLGGVYLCVTKVIDYKVPLMYLASVLFFAIIAFGNLALYALLSGGAVLCAFYMLTDYAVCPKSILGKAVYAVGAGLVTVLIWKYATNFALGAYYATLIVGVIASAVKGYYRPKITGEIKNENI